MRILNVESCAIFLGIAVASACGEDASGATIYQQRVTFQYAQVISAYPGKKKADNTWERVCDGGAVDGILTNVEFVSSLRKPAPGTDIAKDRDRGIRPRDTIDSRVVSGASRDDIRLEEPGDLSLQLDCIDASPHWPGSGADNSCVGATPGELAIDSVRFHENTRDRETGSNVLVLIDQSGSLAGLINREPPFPQTYPAAFSEDSVLRVQFPPGSFTDFASDPNDARVTAARTLILDLNDQDRVGVLAFGEGDGAGARLKVPCTDAVDDVTESLTRCFGSSNRQTWTAAQGIDVLKNTEGGRSNLWEAVQTAYRFLRDEVHDTDRANHLIVLTDGPDTCAPGENLGGACNGACSMIGYDAVRTEIVTGNEDPNGPRIHIHFVQFEARGYLGRDPRQVELACLTGGHYQFINSESFPKGHNQFDAAIQTALDNVRFALMGHWEVAAPVPAYADSTSTPVGAEYALTGVLTIHAASNLVRTDSLVQFGMGQGAGKDLPLTWDRRPTVRKPCGGASDCGGTEGACQIVCSAETLTCVNGTSGVKAPENFTCESADEVPGHCCSDRADCQAASFECASCAQQ